MLEIGTSGSAGGVRGDTHVYPTAKICYRGITLPLPYRSSPWGFPRKRFETHPYTKAICVRVRFSFSAESTKSEHGGLEEEWKIKVFSEISQNMCL